MIVVALLSKTKPVCITPVITLYKY